MRRRISPYFVFLIGSLLLDGCAIKQYAISKVGNSLAEAGHVYASDDDPELVAQAIPFSLKTIEGLLAEVPEHHGLLLAAASGFTQYSYAFVDHKAFELEYSHPRESRELKLRAKKLYLRSRGYALRAVELTKSDFIDALGSDIESALNEFEARHVPELYWLAVSWAAAISSDKNDMELLSDLSLVEALISKCLELDEDFDDGALHELMIAFQGSRSELQGGSTSEAREHFHRAMEISDGRKVSPLVSMAESVAVKEQNRSEFEGLLSKALAFDVNSNPPRRLANLIAQQRARTLFSRTDRLFLED